jgi:hypothetical protein
MRQKRLPTGQGGRASVSSLENTGFFAKRRRINDVARNLELL